jgi:hypothetical protein
LYLWKTQKQNQNVTKQASFCPKKKKKNKHKSKSKSLPIFSSLIVKLVSYCNSSQSPTEVTA